MSFVDKLKVHLLGEPGVPVVGRPTDNLEAYNLWLKGRHYLSKWTGTAFAKSLEYFARAVEVEPGYAQAHAGVAQVLALRIALSHAAPRNDMPRAKESALRRRQ